MFVNRIASSIQGQLATTNELLENELYYVTKVERNIEVVRQALVQVESLSLNKGASPRRLVSPINTAAIEQMAGNLSTSSWSSNSDPAPEFNIDQVIENVFKSSKLKAKMARPDNFLHYVHSASLDESDERSRIELEESEVRCILQCYSCRVIISCDILQHQLLTLLDHIQYHHEALLMQHIEALNSIHEKLTKPDAQTMPLRRSEHTKPTHVNRLL